MEISRTDQEFLTFLAKGGLATLRVYGKTTITIDVVCKPRFPAGMRQIGRLEDAGLIRRGEPSPYKSGKSFPYILTEVEEIKMLNPVYCRQLEDKSGFGVFQGIVKWDKHRFEEYLCEKWELCLGVGSSKAKAWKDYHKAGVNS